MAHDERKLATSPLIPLEIDPASILSLSKGVIFDTIVHNIEYTLSNRRTDPLPWKLVGMSLICDPTRNKKYMQKLQKMQCVPSVICTQIYHSKLVKTDSGILATPGRKIIIPTVQRKRLTGIIVCRSIDELLFMESSNTENVHFIQYKLLSYERIATRELVNGPKLPSIGDKIIKTVFDFELTQNNGFPRQLLPVAIISFSRQDDCDLCLSIRNFLKMDEHKTFDKSYLVTSINVEIDRLREEQERKEDAEAEQELIYEKIQQRQPLAELSKKTTDTGNARPPSSTLQPPLRVPPLKIKLPRQEKTSVPPISKERKFQCLLKLDRIDLSLYDISNVSDYSKIKNNTSNQSSTDNKTKSLTITKPYEHHKSLKRLNTSETKKQLSLPPEISKEKRNNDLISIRSSTSDVAISSFKNQKKRRTSSTSSMSPIYRPKPTIQKRKVEKPVTKKKVNRPPLPSEYHCSLKLTRIDLSMYDLDLPPITTSANTIPMDVESTVTTSPSTLSLSEQQTESSNTPVEAENIPDATQSICMMEQDNVHESEENIFNTEQFFDTDIHQTLQNIVEEFSTPDLNGPASNSSNDILPLSPDEILLQTTNEPPPVVTNEVLPIAMNEIVSQVINELVTEVTNERLSTANNQIPLEVTNELLSTANNQVPLEVTNEIILPATNEVVPTTANEENEKPTSTSSSPCIAYSPDLPPLDDDPVLLSMEIPQIPTTDTSDIIPQVPTTDTSDIIPQDYIIIVPCSDDEDDIDDEQVNNIKNNTITNNTDTNVIESSSSLLENKTSPVLIINPSMTRILSNNSRLKSHRLSSSSSSSCSSISTSILYNQSPGSPLHLTEILIPEKILNKKKRKTNQTINFNRYDLCIPLFAQVPLTDPRLIYRLPRITTDLRWPSPCNQCSITPYLPSLFTSSTQTILYERKSPLDFVDPRREPLKNAILSHIYQRIKTLIPNIFVLNSSQFQKLLFEQTIFKTNCSLHLEYLLHKIKITDDTNFFHMIKTNDEFQLSPLLLQFILN